MRTALVAALLVAAACGGAARRVPPPATPPPIIRPAPPLSPSALEAWSGPEVDRGKPVALPGGGSATVLSRRAGDAQEIVLALTALDGTTTELVPIASLVVGGVRRREVLTGLEPFTAGAETLLRVDVRLFELAAPRFFAVKTALVSLAGGDARVVLDRLVESGNDVIDRRATITARGDDQLVVEERASGVREVRRLRYTRTPGGPYETRDPSMFTE